LVVTREDLSAGQQAVQSVHAGIQFCFDHPEYASEWHSISRYLALVSVKDEDALKALINKCEQRGFFHSVIREPDIGDLITSVAIEPSDKARKLVANYPLTLKDQ
jgi:peptidyl-tRNA hydrolase